MSGVELQTVSSIITLLQFVTGNNVIMVAFFVTSGAIIIVPSILAYKAIKILAGQITPLRAEISEIKTTFAELITEIRNQRDENHKLISRQNDMTHTVMELVERVTRRLTQIESSYDGRKKHV